MFSFTVKNLPEVERNMARRANKLNDRRTVNAACLVVVDRWIQDNFKTEGGKVGGWKPLKPATIAGRRKGSNKALAGQVKILQDKGHLKDDWKHIVDKTTGRLRSLVKGKSGASYGLFHDQGLGNLPKRQIIPEPKQIAPKLKQVYQHFIKQAIK